MCRELQIGAIAPKHVGPRFEGRPLSEDGVEVNYLVA
jgi:hypothetical protein